MEKLKEIIKFVSTWDITAWFWMGLLSAVIGMGVSAVLIAAFS